MSVIRASSVVKRQSTPVPLVLRAAVQGAVPDRVRGRVFSLLDVSWNAMRLLSLALGAVMVNAVGVQVLFWSGGSLLALAGVLGLLLLGGHDFRRESSFDVSTPTESA